MTAIRDSGGNLRLISWKMSSDGKTVTRVADSGSVAGGIDRLSCASLPKAGLLFEPDLGKIVTAVRTKERKLETHNLAGCVRWSPHARRRFW